MEAEIGALFMNARLSLPIRNALIALGHMQPSIESITDNSTAEGIINNRIQPRRIKNTDMRFHWLRYRDSQNQFRYFWPLGKLKEVIIGQQHAAAHYRKMRPEILTQRLLDPRRRKVQGNKDLDKFRAQWCPSARVC